MTKSEEIRLKDFTDEFKQNFGRTLDRDRVTHFHSKIYPNISGDRFIERKDKELFELIFFLSTTIPTIKPEGVVGIAKSLLGREDSTTKTDWKKEMRAQRKQVEELNHRANRSITYWHNLENLLKKVAKRKSFNKTKKESFFGKHFLGQKSSSYTKAFRLGSPDPLIEALKLMLKRRDREALSLIKAAREIGEDSELYKLLSRLLEDRVAEDNQFKQETLDWLTRK